MSIEIPLVNYTANIPQSFNWTSNSDFRFNSYRGLHKAANRTLSSIFADFEDYTGFTLDPNDLTHFSTDENGGNVDIDAMIWDNRGPLTFGIVGLLFAFILTVIGIGWCVVQCCSCGRKRSKVSGESGDNRECDKKKRNYKIACAIVMTVWRVLFM